AHHAGRFEAQGFKNIADLGSGIGSDAIAIASLDLNITAVERDPYTAALAAYNLAPFENAQVICADVQELDLSPYDALWFDPARRSVGKYEQKRLSNPADWSPALDWVFEQAALRPAGIKLSPALDNALIPLGYEAQWVSDRGSVVELV